MCCLISLLQCSDITKPNSCNVACRVIWDEIKKSVSNLNCPPAAAGRLGSLHAFSSVTCLYPSILQTCLPVQLQDAAGLLMPHTEV